MVWWKNLCLIILSHQINFNTKPRNNHKVKRSTSGNPPKAYRPIINRLPIINNAYSISCQQLVHLHGNNWDTDLHDTKITFLNIEKEEKETQRLN